MKSFINLVVVCIALGIPSVADADWFGDGPHAFHIEFVRIGDPGNPPDTTGNPNPAGSVDYPYRIGKYEISEDVIRKANILGGLGIDFFERGPNKPATNLTWPEAERFINWLNTSTGRMPAYKFDVFGNPRPWAPGDIGYDPDHPFRNRLAFYFLPNADEWYKAAYYDPVRNVYYDYPTGSDDVPDGIDVVYDKMFDAVFLDGGINPGPNDVNDVGRLSPYGTAGQGGNVWEMNEGLHPTDEPIRGGYYGNDVRYLAADSREFIRLGREAVTVGFRVASLVPEPSGRVLGAIALVVAFLTRRTAACR